MSFSKIKEQNLFLLKKRFPPLAERIEKGETDTFLENKTIQMMNAKNGDPTLKVNNKWVYSSYNPTKEAQTLLAEIPNNSELFLFFSFGLGYLPLAIANRYFLNPETQKAFPILIVEPDIALLQFALNHIDLAPLLSYPELCFITGKEPFSLLDTLAHYNTPYIYLFKTPLLTQLQSDFFQSCQTLLYQYQDHWEVNLNTSKSFSDVWTRNLFKGIKYIQENKVAHYPVKNLFGQFKDEECLILCAGPSLDSYKNEIKKFKKRGTIITVDTALTFCKENEIEPDFIFISDCQYWNIRHLDFAKVEKCRIITELTVDSHLFKLKPIAFYLYQSRIPLYNAIRPFLPQWGELATGGSVATTAFDFAIHAGFKTIFLAGLDLSYPDNKTHYKGSRFENRTLQLTTQIDSIEKSNFSLLHHETILNAFTTCKNTVKSDSRMLIYRDWFVRHIEANKGNFYRLGKKGIEITGMIDIEKLPPLPEKGESGREKEIFKEAECEPLPDFSPAFFELMEMEKKFLIERQFHLTGVEQNRHPLSAFLWIRGWDFFHNEENSIEEKTKFLETVSKDLKAKIKVLINKNNEKES